MSDRSQIDVFTYLDYRAYLRDFYLEQKARGRGFSYRAFSRRAGLRSPNYLKLVIDGERNLTEAAGKQFARGCSLTGEDAEYFTDLVAFNQAKNATSRATRYAKLTGFRRYREVHRLELAQERYHSEWYLPAIRELACRADFSEDPGWIATRMRPRITKRQAARALALLLDLGLLSRDEDGHVVQSEPLVTTGAETASVHVVAYHRAMLAQASSSIDVVESSQRDISSLTLCLGPTGIDHLKTRIRRLRRELLELAAIEEDPEQVVQVNFQIFPLSTKRSEEAHDE